ncbi:MAG: protein kinase [Acidiferrobacterales bacterium]|nr:protein kinase [Acidiferrobacterales bacterium]
MDLKFEHLQQLGRYQLIREIGRGGMGVVYLARDPDLERDVAIKCVDKGDPSKVDLVDKLRTEARLLAQLNHANIVQLFDVIDQDNMLGLVMEYVSGDSLTRRLRQSPPQQLKIKWLSEVAQGLAFAHQKGIAHCDLKPDNILITQDNVAKLADFGIAKFKADSFEDGCNKNSVGQVTASYFSLSPEQATDQPIDTRSDLFSLAALIYSIIIGKHPFGRTQDKDNFVQKLLSTPFELTASDSAMLGPRLSDLVFTNLKKKPEQRIYSAAETADLLLSELNSNGSAQPEDLTVEIPIQSLNAFSSKTKKYREVLSKVGLVSAGFAFGVLLLLMFNLIKSSNSEFQFVAVDDVSVAVGGDFDPTMVPLIENALRESTQEALLSIQGINLVSQREFKSVKGNLLEKATATGVDSILNLSATCDQDKCNLVLRKHQGEKMGVVSQRSWPIALQELTDIRNSLQREVAKVYPKFSSRRNASTISEEGYRRYLEILLASENGKRSNESHLLEAASILESNSYFAPLYGLATRIAEVLHSRTKSRDVLNRLEKIIDNVPKTLEGDRDVLNAKISLNLMHGDIEKAESVYEYAKGKIDDETVLINLETDIAYYGKQRERLLKLDRKNAVLRPSAKNFYNLAHSEYGFGNHEAAINALNSALKFYPKHSYALGLKGTILMNGGDLESAIENYKEAISLNPTASLYSNIGAAHTGLGKYSIAIEFLRKSIELSPVKARYHLNIADALNLDGHTDLATVHYSKVLDLTAKNKSLASFRQRTQALAHQGKFIEAIRELNEARRQYPDQSNLNYSAAIVYTLSGDNSAALVAIEDAIKEGTGKVWFNFSWFESLCGNQTFRNLTSPETQPLCLD